MSGQPVRSFATYLREGTIVVNEGKGIEEKSHKLMRVVFAKELQQGSDVVLTGPSHVEEVIRGNLTSVIAESANRGAGYLVQEWFSCPAFNVYINDDVTGWEMGGALFGIGNCVQSPLKFIISIISKLIILI